MSSLSPDKFVPTANSTDQDWIQWRTALGSTFGRKKANQIFTIAWGKRGSVGSKANTTALRDYLKGEGLSIDTNGVQDLVDFTENAASSVANGIGDIFSMGKWLTLIVVSGVVVGGVMLVVGIARKPEALVGAAKMAAV